MTSPTPRRTGHRAPGNGPAEGPGPAPAGAAQDAGLLVLRPARRR